MSFFKRVSNALDMVEKDASEGKIADAIKTLEGQLIVEKEFMNDLVGLQTAIAAYHGKIEQMIYDVPKIKKVVRGEAAEQVQMKELHRHVAEAREALEQIKALLSKIWKERRRFG